MTRVHKLFIFKNKQQYTFLLDYFHTKPMVYGRRNAYTLCPVDACHASNGPKCTHGHITFNQDQHTQCIMHAIPVLEQKHIGNRCIAKAYYTENLKLSSSNGFKGYLATPPHPTPTLKVYSKSITTDSIQVLIENIP